MLVDLFDYALPAASIAQRPRPRGQSRLLRLSREGGAVSHHAFPELPALLRPGDLLVRNDARVMPARLLGRTPDGREVELFLTGPAAQSGTCLARPGRRAKTGAVIQLPEGVEARIEEVEPGGLRRVRFTPPLSAELLERIGHVPLPPYIRRPDEEEDRTSYQTIYARTPGSVAAPTAGLHFTTETFSALDARGVEVADVSLRVGPGTFRPVIADDTAQHRMDAEAVRIPSSAADAIRRARHDRRRVAAVGTTVTRALEAWAREEREEFETDLFITPGFEFRIVDALVTNFHLPKSTLLMLVAAFAGRVAVLAAYAEAIREGYRFYSYGDAMLID